MTTFPPDISFWLFYDGQWNDITPDARLTEDHVITLGRPDGLGFRGEARV